MTLTTVTRTGLHSEALDHVFTIGASGTSAYTFQGEGLNGTVNNPTLYLTRGKTYRFENGSGGHPIRIQSTSGANGTAYNTGVTNNEQAGTVIVEVQHDAPDVLYYQCTSHAAMNGILYITGALADGGVTTAKLAADAVTADKIADDAIQSEHYGGTSIDTEHIANAAITGPKIAGDTVGTSNLQNSAVTTAKIADDAVTGPKIQTGAVSLNKLATDSVGTAKIIDASVTLAKLEHGTSSNDGKFLRANNGADPTFETINLTSDNISEGNTKAEVVDTGAGYFKVETDGVERFRVNDNGKLSTGGENSPDVDAGGLCLNTGSSDGIFFSCKNSDIAHGRTSLDETDTLFSMRKISGSNGGVDMRGYTDSASADPAIRIFGVIDDGSNSAYCPVEIRGARKNSGGNTGTSQMHGNRGVVRISNDGDVTVATFTGEGLCFGSDIETANALDDYEEGTWTVALDTGSNTSSLGYYVKIGRMVHIRGEITLDNITSSNNVSVSGLPFQPLASSPGGATFEGSLRGYGAGDVSTNRFATNCTTDSGNRVGFGTMSGQGQGWEMLKHNDFNNTNNAIRFTVTYQTA
jgi:hypothetical protein